MNAVGHLPGLSRLVKRLGGVAQERDLPVFAEQPFTRWWRRRRSSTTSHGAGDRGDR